MARPPHPSSLPTRTSHTSLAAFADLVEAALRDARGVLAEAVLRVDEERADEERADEERAEVREHPLRGIGGRGDGVDVGPGDGSADGRHGRDGA